jgi:hypothetical protein
MCAPAKQRETTQGLPYTNRMGISLQNMYLINRQDRCIPTPDFVVETNTPTGGRNGIALATIH